MAARCRRGGDRRLRRGDSREHGLPIFLSPTPSEESWAPALPLIPFHDYELAFALTNLEVFVPLGILIPLLKRLPS